MKKKFRLIIIGTILLLFTGVAIASRYTAMPWNQTSSSSSSSSSSQISTSRSSSQSTVPSTSQTVDSAAELAATNRDQEWVQSTFDEALQKLVNEGVMQLQPNYVFTYVPIEPANQFLYAPFLTTDAASRYENNTAAVGKKVIVARWDRSMKQIRVLTNGDPGATPRYYPVTKTGSTLSPTFSHIPSSRYASSFEQCDTLILYGGFESERNEKYYEGGFDRVTVTTLVFVLDTKTKTIQHVKVIDTDAPPARTSRPVGEEKISDAIAYITPLLET